MKDILQDRLTLGLIIYSIITSLLLLVATICALGGSSGASNAEDEKSVVSSTGDEKPSADATGDDETGNREYSNDMNHIVDQFANWWDFYSKSDFDKAKDAAENLKIYEYSPEFDKVEKIRRVAKVLEDEADRQKADRQKADRQKDEPKNDEQKGSNALSSNNGNS